MHHADRAAAVRQWRNAAAKLPPSDAWSHLQRVAFVAFHRCRAGVRLHAGHGAVEPADAQHPLTTPMDFRCPQHRALFDVGLEVAPIRWSPGSCGRR